MNALHQQGSERERLHVHGGCDRGGLTQVYELMGTLHEMSEDDSVSTGVQGVTPGYMRELLDLRNIRDECEEWKRKAAQQEKENEALRIQCAQAKEEQRSSGQQLEEIQHRFNELQLLHPSTAMAIEAAEQRLYAKSVLEMSELQGQHEIEAAALHDANEALRQVVTRLCSPNSDFEGGPTSSEIAQVLAGQIKDMDAHILEQQVVIASLLNMLRHVNKERASSTSASWVERIAQSVRQK